MKKYNLLFSLFLLAPTLGKAEDPLIPPSFEEVKPEFAQPARNTFVQFDPLTLSIGGGVRYRTDGNLKGHEHSIRFSPGFSKEFWGIPSYKYSLLSYRDATPTSQYSGVGFKIGMLAHYAPFADIQFIKGWQYASGPFKWGQLEINALPIAVGVIGAATMISDSGPYGYAGGTYLLMAGLATVISFNLAF